ncbi:hypothetical protein PT2222_40295 [Paraburkholderia tropica]
MSGVGKRCFATGLDTSWNTEILGLGAVECK